MRYFVLICVFITALVLSIAIIPDAESRPGGGSSFRSSSRGGGGGGSSSRGSSGGGGSSYRGSSGGGGVYHYSGNGDAVVGYIAIGLIGFMFVCYVIGWIRKGQSSPTSSISSAPYRDDQKRQQENAENKLRAIYATDPNFSKILFLDFVHLIYYQLQLRRSKVKEMKGLAPYFSPNELQAAIDADKRPITVNEVVIGAMRISDYYNQQNQDIIIVEIDANYTITAGNNSTRYLVIERWGFSRKRGVLSKAPEHLQDLECPNCSAPLAVNSDTGQCGHCSAVVEAGDKDWKVFRRALVHTETTGTEQLGASVAEEGTDLKTIYQSNVQQLTNQFATKHNVNPREYLDTFFEKIVRPVFKSLYDSWSNQKWEQARPFMSDNLFRSHYYWIQAYKNQGVVNKLDDAKITKVELVKVEVDKFYECFTVRVFASAIDYAIDRNGKLIGGDKNKSRKFSEYWTFIRRTGVTKTEEQFNPNACPNCGAPVDMGQAGVCNYCNSKVTTGNFNWVLAVITQDEVYLG